MQDAKKSMRKIAKQKRELAIANNPDISNILAQNFPLNFSPNTIISGFYPLNDEIDILPLLKKLAQNNLKIALPRINEENEIDFHSYEIGDLLVISKFGIFEPNNKKPILIPEIMLVPLLAFDKKGNRLGYGKGYYDRVIKKLRKYWDIKTIGIAFDELEFEKVAHDENDEPIDFVYTQSGLRNLAQ